MSMQCPAAGLLRWHDDLDAVARENPCRRGVRVRERGAHHATREERDAATLRADRRIDRRERARRHAARHEREQIGEPTEPDQAERGSRAEPLRDHRRAREGSEHRRPRQEHAERERAKHAFPKAALARDDELRPSRLDELAVFDARRARGLAGAAVEALIDVLREPGAARVDPALPHGLHELDAAARRIHLDAEHRVCRARRQAESAVHAPREQVFRRCVVEARVAAHPTMPRPGSSTPRGSNSALMRRMRNRPGASPAPHAPTRARSPSGLRSIRALPPQTRAPARRASAAAISLVPSASISTRTIALAASATNARAPSSRVAMSAKAACAATGSDARTSTPRAAAGSSRSVANAPSTAVGSLARPSLEPLARPPFARAASVASAIVRWTAGASPRARTSRRQLPREDDSTTRAAGRADVLAS